MLIVVDTVPSYGVTVTADVTTTWAKAAAVHACDAEPSALSAELLVRWADSIARVDGTLSCTLPLTCARCGGLVEYRLGGDVAMHFKEMPPLGTDTVELSDGDMDVSWFDGRKLDLGDAVAEQLGLWLPARILCDDPLGERLAPGTCEVPTHDGGPPLVRNNPFAALKKKQ